MSTKYWVYIGVAILIMAIAIYGWVYTHHTTKWEQQAQQAQQYAKQQTANIDSSLAGTKKAQAKVDTIVKYNTIRDTTVVARIKFIHDSLPPDTIRDPLIDTLRVESEQWHQAYTSERLIADTLETAVARSRVVIDTLMHTLARRPKPRPLWMPHVGIGPIGGYCMNGPCIGVGVALTWGSR